MTGIERHFDELLQKKYGIGIGDTNLDHDTLKNHLDNGETYEELVDEIGDKLDLTPLNETGW